MTSYTYRIEDPDDYRGDLASVFRYPTWTSAVYILMKNGNDVNWAFFREAAQNWCRFHTLHRAQQEKQHD
jgi:hypothetical protein